MDQNACAHPLNAWVSARFPAPARHLGHVAANRSHNVPGQFPEVLGCLNTITSELHSLRHEVNELKNPPKVKVPAVTPITKSWLKENVGNATNLRIQIDLILGAVARIPVNEMTKELAIQSYVIDPEARALVSTHFAHLKNTGWKEGMPFDGEAFTEAFLQSVNSDVRPLDVVALHDLIEGKVTQGMSPVAKYNEHFHQKARLLPNESQESLCFHYLKGLTPELRSRCCLDRNNNRWSSLNNLITFTLAEEERLNLMSEFNADTAHLQYVQPNALLAAFPPMKRARREWKHKGKMGKL